MGRDTMQKQAYQFLNTYIREEKIEVLQSLLQGYEAIYTIDSKKGTLKEINRPFQQPYFKAMSDYMEHKVYEEHKERIKPFLDLQGLKIRLEKEDKILIECMEKHRNGYEWISIEAMFSNALKKDDQKIILAFRNIDKEKKREWKRELEWMQFGRMIAESYDRVYEINYEKNQIFRFLYEEEGLRKVEMAKPFSEFYEEVTNHFIYPKDREKIDTILHPKLGIRKRRENGKLYVELRKKCYEGYCWYGYSLQKIKSENQTTYMLYIKDIDETKQKEEYTKELLRNAVLEAKRANQAKSDFLAKVSHDIRTPMNAVMGMATIALEKLENKQRVEDCLNKILSSSKHLLGLVNHILDMSQIESGKMLLDQKVISLPSFLQEVKTLIEPQTMKKNQEFYLCMKNMLHTTIICDPIRLSQILVNLLSNAIKFTNEKGKIILEIEEKKQNSGFATYQFVIKDNGIGIEEKLKEKLFEPFVRGKDVLKIEGTGLGMAITKRLVDLMNGTLEVKSKLGEGTTFTICIDFSLAEQQEEKKQEEKRAFSSIARGKQFLVVEDNEINREIAVFFLEKLGGFVETAENGKEAVEKVQKSTTGYYDMIFMDIQMPILDGYEATKQIRSLEREDIKILPIIAMTANAFESDAATSLQIGMNYHMAKPLDYEKLETTVRNFLRCS